MAGAGLAAHPRVQTSPRSILSEPNIECMWVAVVKQKWQIELSLHSILQILTVSVFRERASSRCSVDLMRTKKTPNQITIHSVH